MPPKETSHPLEFEGAAAAAILFAASFSQDDATELAFADRLSTAAKILPHKILTFRLS